MYTSKMITCINILIVLLIVPFSNASNGSDYYSSNVEEILNSDPNLSEFRKYLIETGISGQIINGYWDNGITILALTNSAMLPLVSEISFSGAGMSPFDPYPSNSALRGILSLHIIPHYYDGGTLRRAQNNSAITNINRYGNLVPEPSVHVLKLIKYEGGDIGLVSAVPGSEPVYYVKEIKTLPNSISILQISSPIIVPAFLINIITVLQKHGCNTFAELISSRIYPIGDYDNLIYTIDDYYSLVRSGNGITIFAPSDDVMKSANISQIENDILYFSLQLHALDFYAPIDTLEHYNESFVVDFFNDNNRRFILNFSSSDDVVKLHTGSVDAKITSTLFDLPQLIIYSVDHFLLGKVFTDTPSPLPPSPEPTPTPAPAPLPSPAPTPTPSPIPPPSPSPMPAPTPTPPPPLPSPAPSTPPSASPPPPFPRPTPTPPLPSPTPTPTPAPAPSPKSLPPSPTPTPAPAPSPKSLPPTPAPAPSPKSLPPAHGPTPTSAPTPTPTPAPNNGGRGRKDGNVTRNAGFMIMVIVFVISIVI